MKNFELKLSFNYANAWFVRASDLDAVEMVYEDCLWWKNILQLEPVIKILLLSPICKMEKKNTLFDKFSVNKVSDISKSVFYLLNKNKRAGLWPEIVNCFIKIYLKHRNIFVTNVITAIARDSELINKRRKVANGVFDCEDVILVNVVDKKIIGGFILDTNDARYDRSLKTELENFKKKLVSI
ncbi:MAG: ATP synthase F1 subunit delta [Cytophagales bacterium]|jgi:F-type H+-transporting ATPase subunit delta|nr:ATP synthase F1 subunit delta [Cytophagales bacterium]